MGSITVSNLGKAYKQYPTRWSRLAEWMTPMAKPRHQLKWVLQDISFNVNAGEAVGILGVNGAGKSTLLKMITGTTQPTTGNVIVKGKVAALLELGMGFHPDFTGRQNALMAGQLLGYSVEEMTLRMPEIEAFADIGDYIDQPVRIYSSGMQVRLAFSVATVHRPDILIVDEALAVGDAAFQRKCFQRIEFFRASGTTLLLVSHDTSTIKKLCSRALYLKNGMLLLHGTAKLVCDQYEKHLFGFVEDKSSTASAIKNTNKPSSSFLDKSINSSSIEKSFGGDYATIEAVCIQTRNGTQVNVIEEFQKVVLNYKVFFKDTVKQVHFGMTIRTVEGIAVYGTNTDHDGHGENMCQGDIAEISFSFNDCLMNGTYFISCGVSHMTENGRNFLHKRLDCAIFRVIRSHTEQNSIGLANLAASHNISIIKCI